MLISQLLHFFYLCSFVVGWLIVVVVVVLAVVALVVTVDAASCHFDALAAIAKVRRKS